MAPNLSRRQGNRFKRAAWSRGQRKASLRKDSSTRKERTAATKARVFAKLTTRDERPRCATPGCPHDDLTVDHPKGCTWDKYACNVETRWRRYEEEIDAALYENARRTERGEPELPLPCRLLCNRCNGTDGQLRFQGNPRCRSGRVVRWAPDLDDDDTPPRPVDHALSAYLDGTECFMAS